MVGLLATFIGLVGLVLAIPFQPPDFPGNLGPLAVALVGLWVGGILLGYALGIRRRGPT